LQLTPYATFQIKMIPNGFNPQPSHAIFTDAAVANAPQSPLAASAQGESGQYLCDLSKK
jgi:hypothetical protein